MFSGRLVILSCRGAVTALLVGAALSAPPAQSVNAEETGRAVSDFVPEWTWLWDTQTEVGEFTVPSTYHDRKHGRTHERGSVLLRYQLRFPAEQERIRGLMVLVPGLDQHSGRYRYFVEHFRDEFIIASCDTRFMGRSNPELAGLQPGDIPPADAHHGLRNIRKFFYVIYDLDEFVMEVLPREIEERGIEFETLPLILVGHSLGGLAVMDYVLGNDHNVPPRNLAGVILSSPALRPPRGVPSFFQRVIINYNYHVNASFGSNTEQRTLALVTYEQLRDIVMTPIFYLTSLTRTPVDAEWATQWVTDDPWEQIGFQTDPLTIRRNPLNFIYQVQEHMIEIRDLERSITYPYLLFYSPSDHIVNPIGAEEFASRTLNNNPHNRVVPAADTYSHELFRARPAVRNRLLGVAEEWVDELLTAWNNEPWPGVPAR